MKLLGGIYQDTNLSDQPEDKAFFVKNAVSNVKIGALNNENGFKYSNINDKTNIAVNSKIPLGYTVIGAISLMDQIVIFSTDNINGEIGIYNLKADSYSTKLNSTELTFSITAPIEGTWTINALGELIIGWVDNKNSPRVLNLDKVPNPFSINKIEIFKKLETAILDSYTLATGGSFLAGAYYPYYRYLNYSGDSTQWLSLNYLILTETTNNTSITLNLTHVDVKYDLIEIAFYYKTGSTSYERVFKQIIITSNLLTTTITGNETFTDLTQGDLLIPSLEYSTANTCVELSKRLTLGNLKSNANLKYQKYACNIKLKWYSNILDYLSFPNQVKDKGYQHDEVMSFFIRFKLLNGNYSQSFHIPGPKYTDFNPSVADINAVDSNAKNYQIIDYSVPTTINANSCKGTFSYWENQDEYYPKENLPEYNKEEFNGAFDYDGVAILNGRNLLEEECATGTGDGKKGKVKHFKFPSLGTTWTYYNTAFPTSYGLSALDQLGLIVDVDSIFIPDDIADLIQGYEICYGERTINNQTIFAQDYCITGGVKNGVSTQYVTTGCNFGSSYGATAGSHVDKVWDAVYNHSFDLLYNANDSVNHFFPAIKPTHAKFNFDIFGVSSYAPSAAYNWGDVNDLVDSTRVSMTTQSVGGTSSVKYTGSNNLKKIKGSGYVEHHTIVNISGVTKQVDNFIGASSYFLELESEVPFKYTDVPYLIKTLVPLEEKIIAFEGITTYVNHRSANYNLFTLKNNIYEKFTEQNLITTSKTFTTETGEQIIYGGDTFLSICCSNVYGVLLADKISDVYAQDHIRGYHWYVAETRSSDNRRVNAVISTNPLDQGNYKAFYNLTNYNNLKVGILGGGISFVGTARYDYNPNYSLTLNRFVGSIFDPNNKFSNNFPNRVIRSLIQNTDTKSLAWMDFKASDHYDVRRNRGEIIAVRQSTEGRLFIQCVQALFITNNKTTLSTTEVQLKLGSGDIFDIEPIEIVYDNNGYIGSQHRESCIMSRLGYCTVDSLQGKIFLVSSNGDSPREISLQGIRNFCLSYLRDVPNNLNYQGVTNIMTAYDYLYNRLMIVVKNSTKSFTISYSPDLNDGQGGWLSFHDYIPDLIYSTRHNTLSFKKDYTNENNLYIHNIGTNKGVYYKEGVTNVIKPFIVIPVFNTIDGKGKYAKKIFQSIYWKTEVKNTIAKYLETFNSVNIWNDYQCSEETSLVFDSTIGEGNIRSLHNYWHYNQLRDILIHSPIGENDFSVFLKDLFNNYDIITTAIDPTKDDFEQKRFAHTFIAARLLYNNLTNSEFSLLDISTKAIVTAK